MHLYDCHVYDLTASGSRYKKIAVNRSTLALVVIDAMHHQGSATMRSVYMCSTVRTGLRVLTLVDALNFILPRMRLKLKGCGAHAYILQVYMITQKHTQRTIRPHIYISIYIYIYPPPCPRHDSGV